MGEGLLILVEEEGIVWSMEEGVGPTIDGGLTIKESGREKGSGGVNGPIRCWFVLIVKGKCGFIKVNINESIGLACLNVVAVGALVVWAWVERDTWNGAEIEFNLVIWSDEWPTFTVKGL